MEKPELVYLTKIPERLGWIGCFYSIDNAKQDCMLWALGHKYKEENLYFDDIEDRSYLMSKNGKDDLPIAIINEYMVQDADE